MESYSVSKLLDAGKTYSVSLTYDDGIGTCISSHQNEFKVGRLLQTTVSAMRESPLYELHYKFSENSVGTPPYSYIWDFGDSSPKSYEASPTHSFGIVNGRHKVKLVLIDSKKDTCISYYQIPGSPENMCEANYTATFTPLENTKIFGSVTVLLTDPSGTVYSSRDYIQGPDSWFNIVSVNNYSLKNKYGESTKSVNVKFNCKVKNGNKIINLTNGEAMFAVSYE